MLRHSMEQVDFFPFRLYWVLTTWSFSTALTCSWLSRVLIESSGKSTLQERQGVSKGCWFGSMQSDGVQHTRSP